MRSKVAPFLPTGVRVLALPNSRTPRLFLASVSVRQRWRHSGYYPAFRWTARVYAATARLRAVLGMADGRPNRGVHWQLGAFLEDCLPGAEGGVVAIGTPGPASKLTVQVWRDDAVVGYVKYATTPIGMARLEHEAKVVASLPAGLGPRLLKIGEFSGGLALVTAAVAGRAVPARLPMHRSMRGFLEACRLTPTWPVDRHPWVVRVRERTGERLDRALEPLANAAWPEVIHHGDFAPWNVLRTREGRLVAIDWEYADMRGFPHLDAAYFSLQVAALVRRWSPERARDTAIRGLDASLKRDQADAIVRLTALAAHQQAMIDGHPPDSGLQAWRRAIWAGQ